MKEIPFRKGELLKGNKKNQKTKKPKKKTKKKISTPPTLPTSLTHSTLHLIQVPVSTGCYTEYERIQTKSTK